MLFRHLVALTLAFLATLAPIAASAGDDAAKRPNIVLVVIDDQGYSDLGVMGNPFLQTPQLDQLWNESARFTDFHTDPMCSQTRAALMTGRSSVGAGVYWTIMSRNILPADRLILPQVLKANGYRTALFGKWHLGDNYPFRPQDRGFDHVVMTGGGGVGQTWDQWGNSYFGGTYLVNGEPTRFAQYANDVWFDEADKFIREESAAGRPFFAYIPTNNAHGPFRAPYATLQKYLGIGLGNRAARFYAMMEEVDTRVGELRETLRALDIERDTIFIYMSDNGSALGEDEILSLAGEDDWDEYLARYPALQGWEFNAGLAEKKGSVMEGGHRVPFMLRWPGGGIDSGREIDALTAHYDILPTLVDWLGLTLPEPVQFEGRSFAPALAGKTMPDRSVIVVKQNSRFPEFERPAMVMTESWRYSPDQKRLWNIEADWGQKRNVASQYPDVAARMHKIYESWWKAREPEFVGFQRPIIGTSHEPVTRLTAIDAKLPAGTFPTTVFPWYPGESDLAYGGSGGVTGFIGRETEIPVFPIAVEVAKTGTYRISLFLHDKAAATEIPFTTARLTLSGRELSKPVGKFVTSVDFEVALEKGELDFATWFEDPAKTAGGEPVKAPAFYVYLERIGD